MSLFGKAVKGSVTLIADGLDFVIRKGTQAIEKKYGEKDYIHTASEIGSGAIRASETTVKTLADVVDGGLEAGLGHVSKDQDKKQMGIKRTKSAGQELVDGIGKGLTYTVKEGARTTNSAVQAGKHYVRGNKDLAFQELARSKALAKNLGKTVAVGLLAFGPVDPDQKNKNKDFYAELYDHDVSGKNGD